MIDKNKLYIIKKINVKDNILRRFLDIGLTPNTIIEKVLESPKKDPMAYFFRGTVIAIRNEDANLIEVEEYSEIQKAK